MPKPKPGRLPSAVRRFGSMRILADGRIQYSAWIFPNMSELQFTTHHRFIVVDLDGKSTVVYRIASYSTSVHWLNRQILILAVERRRVQDAVFPHDLTPEELQHAVSVLRKAGNGLERWITPGLLFLRRTLNNMERHPQREALKPLVPRLLRSVRSIPLPKPWIQFQREKERLKQREWERWEREKAWQRKQKR